MQAVIIDDGSSDQTWNLIEKETKHENRIKAIKFSRNFGQHYAITAGLRHAQGEWIVVMDGDFQDRPENIPKLYKKAKEGYDIVFLSRQNRPETRIYKVMQKIFYRILRLLSGIKFDSSQANFSILNTKVVKAFNELPENARFFGSTVLWLGFKRTSIMAEHGKRLSGKTSYTIKKRIKLAYDIIISFSERPLKIAIYLGFIMSTAAACFSIYIFYKNLFFGFSVPGWASTLIVLLFSTGINLLILGILGIYVGAIFREVKSRPLYVIDKSLGVFD